MKYKFLKTKTKIIQWLNKYNIQNYILIPDKHYGFIIDVYDSVYLTLCHLKWIPVKFNHVHGNFDCAHNQLISLEFCPTIANHFNCSHNQLTSLKFCPQKIVGNFNCSYNQLLALNFLPKHVDGYFYCHSNEKLMETQSIKNFNEIYQIHLHILIEQNKNSLEQKITNIYHPNKITENTLKIKIAKL